ncbi:GD17959 [Drosophila simulans]|uniref:GD17959 n=1 Tax=Drosophila simulans TaxID=7240 RepID=B4NTF9_DROSI|nr:GD17959 [Drosophila simulans]
MALQLKVNGKFGANLRRTIGPLDDPEQVRKDLESELRITRLKQVTWPLGSEPIAQ